MLRHRDMVPVTYLFVVLFGERTWANEFAFAAWPRRPDRRLNWWEQHVRLGMCFFVSGERVLRSLSWMWASRRLASEAKLLLSQVVDRVGRIEVPPPLAAAPFMYMYRLTGASISGLLRKHAMASPFIRASCYFWSSNGHTSTTVWQKIRSVPHFLQLPAIDKEPESNAKMYVNQRRDELARTWKHILRHDHFRAKYRYVGVFFERRFQPLSVGGFFSNQRESISRCPKSPFPSKTQKSTNSPNFSFKYGSGWGQNTKTNIELNGKLCTFISLEDGHLLWKMTIRVRAKPHSVKSLDVFVRNDVRMRASTTLAAVPHVFI